MKALTIHQPWASLLAIGAKRYETRGWATKYRGAIAIHAGKAKVIDLREETMLAASRCLGIDAGDPLMYRQAMDSLPRGAVIAVAALVDCHEIYARADGAICIAPRGVETVLSGDERAFGLWESGRFAWELADVRILPAPCPAMGQQGLWNWEV